MPPCPPSPPPEAPSPPASPPSHAAADPIIPVPKLQRPLTPTEQLLGKQCRSNSDGDGPPETPGKQDKELLRPPHTLTSTTTLEDALSIAYGIAYPSPTHEHNPSLINRLIDTALSRSLIKSSHALTPASLMEAAWTLNPTATPLTPLVEVLPLHYDALFSSLSDIHQDSAALKAKGIGRPLVLVVRDTHGVIASMFRAAGGDVATSDPLPSTVSHAPHFVGAPDVLLDAGFDLIIRLNTDSSPSTYRTPRAPKLDVPYFVYETSYVNPDPFTNRSTTSQVVCPCDHGINSAQPMGLNLSAGLPQIQPTCVTATKDMPILPHHAPRAEHTRASYGIAIAMAAQWTPFLNERRKSNPILIPHTVTDVFNSISAPSDIDSTISKPEEASTLPLVRVFIESNTPGLSEVLSWVTPTVAAGIAQDKLAKAQCKGLPVFNCSTHTGPSVRYEPWLDHTPRIPLPLRPVCHVRNIRGTWKAWQVTHDGPEARLYGWVALSDSINIELNAALIPGSVLTVSPSSDEHVPHHVTSRRKLFNPSLNSVSEHMVSLMKHISPNSHFIANVSTKAPLYKSLYKVWDKLPPPRGCPNLGLGATPYTPHRPPLSKRLSPEQLANCIRAQHKLFVAQTPAEPSVLIVAATMPIPNSTVTDTPTSGCRRHCLFC